MSYYKPRPMVSRFPLLQSLSSRLSFLSLSSPHALNQDLYIKESGDFSRQNDQGRVVARVREKKYFRSVSMYHSTCGKMEYYL
jgi:hypothetical protein